MRQITKRVLLALISTAFVSLALAETCPSVDTIRRQAWTNQWKIYDSSDDKPISAKRLTEALKSVDQLTLAEWSETKGHMGTIRCYYRDKHGSHLEAYFANDHYKPDNTHNVWYPVTGHLHCAASLEQCVFTDHLIEAKR